MKFFASLALLFHNFCCLYHTGAPVYFGQLRGGRGGIKLQHCGDAAQEDQCGVRGGEGGRRWAADEHKMI